MTEEDYLAWREHPVTKWVMEAFDLSARKCRDQWLQISWDGVNPEGMPKTSEAVHRELFAKAVTYQSMSEAEFADIEARHNEYERN